MDTLYSTKFFEVLNFCRLCNFKRFAETVFADQGNLVSHAFQKKKIMALHIRGTGQSTNSVKIMHLKNLVLCGSIVACVVCLPVRAGEDLDL